MLYLVRHGESQANIQKRYSGITDVDLSENGVLQAKAAGQNLMCEKITHIFSSSLKRAKETAIIIKNEIKFPDEIVLEPCLVEVNFGIFENMTWDEMRTIYREETENWILQKHKYKFPKGEGYDDIIKRVADFINSVPDNSLIVTHFGVIQSILLYLGVADDANLWDFTVSNCDVIVLNNKKFDRIIRNN